jgi:hypothetical protein
LCLELKNYNTKEYNLTYPIIKYDSEIEPDKLMMEWLKKKNIKIGKYFKKTLKTVTLVGKNNNILVFSVKYKKE